MMKKVCTYVPHDLVGELNLHEVCSKALENPELWET